jgi:hypothetical protein
MVLPRQGTQRSNTGTLPQILGKEILLLSYWGHKDQTAQMSLINTTEEKYNKNAKTYTKNGQVAQRQQENYEHECSKTGVDL